MTTNLMLAVAIGVVLGRFLDRVFTYGLLLSRRDDTDEPKGERSGMRILVDHKTGLQYLTTAFGGLTPRLDRDGNHMTSEAP